MTPIQEPANMPWEVMCHDLEMKPTIIWNLIINIDLLSISIPTPAPILPLPPMSIILSTALALVLSEIVEIAAGESRTN
ncbi:hypothetical protein TMatcc_002706 [Talaromyces marneffei ATCC 18224]